MYIESPPSDSRKMKSFSVRSLRVNDVYEFMAFVKDDNKLIFSVYAAYDSLGYPIE